MKKKVLIVIGVLILLVVSFVGGMMIPSKDTNKDEKNGLYGFNDGFKMYDMNVISNYFVVSGVETVNNEETQCIYIFDGDMKLQKRIENAFYMEHHLSINDSVYSVDIDLGRGGAHTTTYILDENFDTIIKSDTLPEQFEGMDEGLFTAFFNSDDTISILINDVYVYDFDGKLVKTIKNENDMIQGVTKDYYLTKNDGKISLVKYSDNSEYVVAENNSFGVWHYLAGGGQPAFGWSETSFDEPSLLGLTLVEGDSDDENAVCHSYKFSSKDGVLTQVGLETKKCYG